MAGRIEAKKSETEIKAVGEYQTSVYDHHIKVELWHAGDLLAHVNRTLDIREDVVCGARIVGKETGIVDVLMEYAMEHVEGHPDAAINVLCEAVFGSARVRGIKYVQEWYFTDAFLLTRFPPDAPDELLMAMEYEER